MKWNVIFLAVAVVATSALFSNAGVLEDLGKIVQGQTEPAGAPRAPTASGAPQPSSPSAKPEAGVPQGYEQIHAAYARCLEMYVDKTRCEEMRKAWPEAFR
jgi:hypothetical protein